MQKYYCEGMKFYGEKIPLDSYQSVDEPTLFLGLYFQEDYNAFVKHKGKRIVFWNGSDVLRLLANPEWIYIIQNSYAEHYCHNQQLKDELASIGIDSAIVPLFFGYKDDYKLYQFKKNKNQIFISAHPYREEEYGVPIILEIASELKNMDFHIFGITGNNTDNVFYHGWINEEDMNNKIQTYNAVVRLNLHDGFSQVVIKSMLYGLKVIISRDKETIKKELLDLQENYIYDIDYIKDLNWFQAL